MDVAAKSECRLNLSLSLSLNVVKVEKEGSCFEPA